MNSDKPVVFEDDGKTIITSFELESLIRDTVRDAVKNHICRINLSDEVINEIPDVMNALKHIGGGSITKGIMDIEDNHRTMKSLRRKSDALAVKISNFILLAIVGGLISAVWLGIKECLKME